jgi:sugar lactone lactonase YvrE
VIIVDKVTDPAGSEQMFAFNFSGSYIDPETGQTVPVDEDFSLKDTDDPWISPDLYPGSFSVIESVPDGWTLDNVTCENMDGESKNPENIELAWGETVTCTFFNELQAGNIIVDKVTIPAGDPQEFNFTLKDSDNVEVATFNLADATMPFDSGDLMAGMYSVVETALAGWSLTDVTCLSSDGETTYMPNALDLSPGETITCTFTNTKLAKLTIVKNTVGGDGAFDFVSETLPDLTFTITTVMGTGSKVFDNLALGTYDVDEVVPIGWDLTSAVCDNGDPIDAIELGAGDVVTCTFTDTKLAKLTIVKNTIGGDGAFDFVSETLPDLTFTITTVMGTGSKVFDNLALGTYDVDEVVPIGWDLTSAVCDNGDPIDAIELGAGDVVTCTFTDTKLAKLTIVKNTIGGDGAFDFVSETLPDLTFTITTVMGTGSKVFDNLALGTYDVDEVVPIGWDLTSAVCDNGDPIDAIELGAGDVVTCTFTDTKLAKLTIVKNTIGGDGAFDFVSETLPDLTFTITTVMGTGSKVFDNLALGTYDVDEVVPIGWDLTSAVCDNGDPIDAIELGAGDVVTCTFTDTKLAKLTIVKNTIGGDGAFDFVSETLPDLTFTITTVMGTGSKVFDNLALGTYDVDEVVPIGWDLTSAVCDNGDPIDAIELGAGDVVTCTFTDTKLAKLTIVKNTIGGDGAFDFVSETLPDLTFTITTVMGTGSKVFDNLALGTYDVDEVVPIGWDLTSAVCDNGDPIDAIELGAGDVVTCTFTDTKLAKLTIVKNTIGGDGAFDFVSETLPDLTFTITTVMGTGSKVFDNLALGTYDVDEVVPIGWDLTSASAITETRSMRLNWVLAMW